MILLKLIETDYKNLEKLYLRFERQTVIPRPEIKSFIFFIHSHYVDCETNPQMFINAIKKAHPESYLKDNIKKNGSKMLRFLKEKAKAGKS